jgi:hypothetical protein
MLVGGGKEFARSKIRWKQINVLQQQVEVLNEESKS